MLYLIVFKQVKMNLCKSFFRLFKDVKIFLKWIIEKLYLILDLYFVVSTHFDDFLAGIHANGFVAVVCEITYWILATLSL